MADKKRAVMDDPEITDSTELNPGSGDNDDNPKQLGEISFQAGDETVTIGVDDSFVADNGQIVGEVDRIVQQNYDTSKRINTRETVHWVWIDYSKGGYWPDESGTGGVPLGEIAEQIANNDMSVKQPAEA